MYSKKKINLKSEGIDLNSYMEGTDIFNSKLLYMLPKLPSSGTYTVDLAEHRIDLIANILYQDKSLAPLLLLYNGLTIDQLTKGTVLEVPFYQDILKLIEDILLISSPKDFLKNL
jgi:hypothetical protein